MLFIGCILGFGAEANKLYYFGDFTAEMQFPMGLRNEPFMLALTKSMFRLDTTLLLVYICAAAIRSFMLVCGKDDYDAFFKKRLEQFNKELKERVILTSVDRS